MTPSSSAAPEQALPVDTFRVRVPATSANLGPGFDTFGLALGRYDEVDAAVSGRGLEVEVSGEAAEDVPRDETHLVVSALLTGLRRWYGEPPGLRVRCRNTIPHGRGLGSSAAAIVAGVVAARELAHHHAAREHIDDREVLELATELEGHPDNVAAALFGGFTLAWVDESGARAVRLRPHDAIVPVVCVPDWPMSTETARGLLPDTVAHADAVFNATRSGLLVAALTQLPERLFEATEDRLHQPYRAAAMPATDALLSDLRAAGIPAVLSGAGPTVLTLCERGRLGRSDVAHVATRGRSAGDGWRVEAPGLDQTGVSVTPVGPSADRADGGRE
jgi:homoserine kinase